MEQNKEQSKKYEELNCYERAMANATLEQRLEAMARDLEQISLALKTSIHIDATFHDWENNQHSSCGVALIKGDNCTRRDVKDEGDLFGIIDEANKKKEHPEE